MNTFDRIRLCWRILTKRTSTRAMQNPTDEMDITRKRDIKEMLHVSSTRGHSGFSTTWAAGLLVPLVKFEPIGPLSGELEEWVCIGDGVFQNTRCGRVFRSARLFNGQAYDIEGRVFRGPSGACYISRDSLTPIKFPYIPSTVYVDVNESLQQELAQ